MYQKITIKKAVELCRAVGAALPNDGHTEIAVKIHGVLHWLKLEKAIFSLDPREYLKRDKQGNSLTTFFYLVRPVDYRDMAKEKGSRFKTWIPKVFEWYKYSQFKMKDIAP